jgi:uncharacterized membrane protein
MLITSVLPSRGPSAGVSATSSPSHCAGPIIGPCIDMATRPRGGKPIASMPSRQLESYGSGPGWRDREGDVSRPCSAWVWSRARTTPSPVLVPQAPINQSRRQGRPADDLISTNRSQSRNALRSTGPKTEEGKRQSRRNAVRHGLTAETVIDGLEDSEDYRAFEASVIADYDARTAVERELVLRLASLLWRLRRSISIESDLLRIQSDIVRQRRPVFYAAPVEPERASDASRHRSPAFVLDPQQDENTDAKHEVSPCSTSPLSVRALTYCFLRLSNVDNGAFERLGRYNAALWKQTAQTLFLLQTVRRPQL